MSTVFALSNRVDFAKGSINLHKSNASVAQKEYQEYTKPTQYSNASSSPSWKSARAAPYSRGRARAGRYITNPHRNRTLVLSNATTSSSSKDITQNPVTSAVDSRSGHDEDPGTDLMLPSNGWVTKRDRHMQLINSTVFDKETQLRNKAINQTRRQRALQRDQREKYKINKHLRGIVAHAGRSSAVPTATASPTIHEISLEGLRFQVMDGGSKLARVRGKIAFVYFVVSMLAHVC